MNTRSKQLITESQQPYIENRPISNPASSQKTIEPENDGEMKMQKTGNFETPKVTSYLPSSQVTTNLFTNDCVIRKPRI